VRAQRQVSAPARMKVLRSDEEIFMVN